MSELHVIPNARGTWQVRDQDCDAPISEHASATAAELAAWFHCDEGRANSIVVHDRYGRTRDAVPFERRRGTFARAGSRATAQHR